MGTLELKSNIHKIVDRIQSEQLLRTIYDFLKVRETSKSGNIWNSLTEEQKQEVLMAYEESENENNLIDSEKIFKREK